MFYPPIMMELDQLDYKTCNPRPS